MGKKSFVGKVLYRIGCVINGKTEDSYGSQTEAWKADADCGCGIDCCERKLVLTDQTRDKFMSLYFEDGSLKFMDPDGNVFIVTAVEQEE